jgi:epoxide hydrolase-like predicted phosphatase
MPTMPLTAVVFDIGGVLEINPATGWGDRWASRLEREPHEFAQLLEDAWAGGAVGTATIEEIERRTADALELDDETLAALMDDAWAEYVGTLNHDLADYFRSLRPRYKTGILSNSFVGAREREQEAHGFEEMCDVIVYSHEVGCTKPDPRIYHVVCERLAVRPADAVLLDDVEENVDGARAIGMRAITFVNNEQAIAELQEWLSG